MLVLSLPDQKPAGNLGEAGASGRVRALGLVLAVPAGLAVAGTGLAVPALAGPGCFAPGHPGEPTRQLPLLGRHAGVEVGGADAVGVAGRPLDQLDQRGVEGQRGDQVTDAK
jgi:hypothetical protein